MNGLRAADLPALELRDPVVTALLLGMLTALFALRVVGQLAVATGRARWLPPMGQWYSGLIPYAVLLAIQVAVIVAMIALEAGLALRTALAEPRPLIGSLLVVAAYPYAASMALRYAIRMLRRPDQRWLGGTIPIVFHVVLSAWLFVLGSYWRG